MKTMTAHSDEAFAKTLSHAEAYRKLGYQPLPSKMNIKGPLLATFADYWDKPLPENVYTLAAWKTTNIQLMTGRHWKLCVVDLDGPEAKEVWIAMVKHFGGCPRTWVAATGGGGFHFYFTVPDYLDECPSRRLWGVWDTWAGTNPMKPGGDAKGNWQKHKEIRILGDNALVIAPPSVHVESGKSYDWITGPEHMLRPAEAPGWLMRMPAILNPACVEAFTPAAFASNGPGKPSGASYRRDDVLAAIPSKIDVAREWGLRIASGGPNPKGWWTVHAIDRPDATASASFHDLDGVYWESRDGVKLSYFDLAVALNAFTTWQECRDALGDRFLKRATPARIRPPTRE